MTSVEIVEKIKRVLADPEGLTFGALSSLARDYASRCRRLDERLGRAVACVHTGALCEAARLVQDGNLLNEFQALSFENVDEWQAICRQLGCDVAAKVSADNGKEMQLFYFSYEESRDLFARHRLLALQGAAPKDRLDVLYRLRAKFPKCQSFIRSIGELEKAREREIANDLKKIDSSNPPEEFFRAALAELESPNRVTPASQELLTNLHAWEAFAASSTLTAQLRELLNRWAVAYSENDEKSELACLNRYRTGVFAPALGYVEPDERETIELLQRHAAQIERRDQARAELKRKTKELARASETFDDVDKLSNLMATAEMLAENAQMQLDPALKAACARRVESLQLQKSRRSTVVMTAGAAILVLFSVAALFSIYRAQTQRDASKAAETINSKLDEFERNNVYAALEEAAAFVERNGQKHPNYKNTEAYEKAEERFARVQEAENKRAARLNDEMIKYANQLKNNELPPVASLKSMCRTKDELNKYEQLQKRYRKVESENSARVNDEFRTNLETLAGDLEAAKEKTGGDAGPAIAKARSFLTSLRATQETSKIEGTLIQELDAIETQLDGLEKRFASRQKDDEFTRGLISQVGSISAYSEKLGAAALDGESAALVESAKKDVENAARAERYNLFIGKNGDPLAWAKNADAFAQFSSMAEGAKEMLDFAPEYSELEEKIRDWRGFAEAGGFDKLEKALREALELYSKKLYLYYDGTQYVYLTEKPVADGDNSNVLRQIKANGDTEKWSVPSSWKEKDFDRITETVQSQWHRELAERKFDGPRDLIKYVAEFLDKVYRATDEQLDPAIEVKFLKDVFDGVGQCPGFEEANEIFKEAWLDNELSLDFDPFAPREEAQADRKIATAILKEAGSLSDLLKGVEKEFEEAAAVSWPRYEWVGFIDAAAGEASVKLGDSETVRKKLAKSATLWIARGDSPAVQCGEFVDGKPELNSARDWAQYRWTPVYQRVEPNNQ